MNESVNIKGMEQNEPKLIKPVIETIVTIPHRKRGRKGLAKKSSKQLLAKKLGKRRKLGGRGRPKTKSNPSSTNKTTKITKTGDEDSDVYGILEEKNIKQVQFGTGKLFPTWYGSTVYFDRETKNLGIFSKNNSSSDEHTSPQKKNTEVEGSTWLDTLYVCEYCFKYTDDREALAKHDSMCSFKLKNPPGKIKYRSPQYTIRRVKGFKNKLFCQCLCLFTKLFLDNKSIYFKVDNYEFYILYPTGGHTPMAFFSKDVTSYNQNNLACILTLPPYQRKGLGSLLIEFSYKLSRSQGLVSGPELPLSPFGLIGYTTHWVKVICWHLIGGDLDHLDSVSINELSIVTGFRITDIIMALNYLECLDQKTGTINMNVIRQWIHNRKNTQFMLQDEYLLIGD